MRERLFARWKSRQQQAFLELLEEEPGARLLDLGCGEAQFTRTIADTVRTDDVVGADVWEDGVTAAAGRGIDVIKCDLDAELPLEADEFDVVVANQVIEHLRYPQQFLREIQRVVSPSGYVVLSTENLSSWDNLLALSLGYTPFSMEFDRFQAGNPLSLENKEQATPYPPHVRIFTYYGLLKSAERVGFDTERIEGSGYLPWTRLDTLDPRHARFITAKFR